MHGCYCICQSAEFIIFYRKMICWHAIFAQTKAVLSFSFDYFVWFEQTGCYFKRSEIVIVATRVYKGQRIHSYALQYWAFLGPYKPVLQI